MTDDVHVLLERLSGHAVPEAFAALLATETDGNPSFLRETLLHLVDDGWLRFENGAWVADATRVSFSIPAGSVTLSVGGFRDRRRTRKSAFWRRALLRCRSPSLIAATVTDTAEHEALDVIDEALEAELRRPDRRVRPVRVHSCAVPHTLVEELNPSRQVRMHRESPRPSRRTFAAHPIWATAAMLARHYLRSSAKCRAPSVWVPYCDRGRR